MALPIRDGNQSLTTLSTILVSNSHIPAHTVVSFGAQAITDIATAVSGVELGPNTLNALENITVTLGQVTITGGLTDAQLRASAVTIGGVVTATISGTPSVTFGTAVITGSTSILNFPATQAVTFGEVVVTGSTSIIGTPSVTFTQASITFGLISGTVTIGSLPAISGTVTANLSSVRSLGEGGNSGGVLVYGSDTGGSCYPIPLAPDGSLQVGTVTANLGSALPAGTNSIGVVTIGGGTVTIGAGTAQIGSVTASISGTVPISISSVTVGNSVTVGSLPAISGTVTASLDASGVVGAEQPIPSQGIQLGYNVSGEFLGVSPTNRLPVNVGEPVVSGRKSDAGSIYPLPVNQDGEPAGGLGMPIGFHYDSDFKIVEANYPLPISGTVTVGNSVTIGTVTANTRNNGISNDPWVYIPRLTMSHPDTGNFVFDGYYRFNGENQWGSPNFNSGNCAYLTRFVQGDNYFFNLMVHDEANDQEIIFAQWDSGQTTDFPTSMIAISGTLVSGSLTFNTEQRESYGVRVTNSVTVGNSVTIGSLPAISGTVTANVFGTNLIDQIPLNMTFQGDGFLNGNRLAVSIIDGQGTEYGTSSPLIVSGTVTAVNHQGTTVTTSNFTSTTPSTILASANTDREVLTIFNEGAGNLHISAGATCTTIAYQVRLLAGDYYEVPINQTSLTHSAVFATAGTARVTQVS